MFPETIWHDDVPYTLVSYESGRGVYNDAKGNPLGVEFRDALLKRLPLYIVVKGIRYRHTGEGLCYFGKGFDGSVVTFEGESISQLQRYAFGGDMPITVEMKSKTYHFTGRRNIEGWIYRECVDCTFPGLDDILYLSEEAAMEYMLQKLTE